MSRCIEAGANKREQVVFSTNQLVFCFYFCYFICLYNVCFFFIILTTLFHSNLFYSNKIYKIDNLLILNQVDLYLNSVIVHGEVVPDTKCYT